MGGSSTGNISLSLYDSAQKRENFYSLHNFKPVKSSFVCFLFKKCLNLSKRGVNKIYKIWGKGLKCLMKSRKKYKTYLSWQYAEKHIIMLLWFLWQSLHYDPNIFHSYWTHPLIPAPNSVSSKPTDFVLKKKYKNESKYILVYKSMM